MHVLAANAASNAAGLIIWILIIAIAVAAYWLPTLIARRRHVPALGQVVVVNLFLGWTGIGWVVALVMAFRTAQPHQLRPAPGPGPTGDASR